MSTFVQLVSDLRRSEAELFVWMLSAVTGADGISAVLAQIKRNVPEAAETCDGLLGLSREDLEQRHGCSFKMFFTRAAPGEFDDLRAEAVAVLGPREEAQKRHLRFLSERAKKKALAK